MIFLWNHYPHTISSGTDSKLSVVLICIFIYRAPHIGFLYSDGHFLVICYPEPIYFLKKKENQVKIPSIFFKKHYNTKASTQTEYFFEKLFEPSSFRSETEHVFFSYVVKENQLT